MRWSNPWAWLGVSGAIMALGYFGGWVATQVSPLGSGIWLPFVLIASLAAVPFIIVLYCLPMCEAYGREHRNANAIAIVNLFLGWTFIGWVAALAWAYSDDGRILEEPEYFLGEEGATPGGRRMVRRYRQ